MGHPAQTYLKNLTSDKFNPSLFNVDSLEDFLDQVINYLSIKNKPKEESSKTSKNSLGNQICTALKKLLPILEPKNIVNCVQKFENLFLYLLHPLTGAKIRSMALDLFLEFLLIVDEGAIGNLNYSLQNLIPFSCFARDDLEKHDLDLAIKPGSSPIYGEGLRAKSKDAIKDLTSLLDYIKENWERKKEFCGKLLFEYVLNIIYKPWASESLSKPYGFRPPAPPIIHEKIICFLEKFLENNIDVIPFIGTLDRVRITFGIFRDSASQNDIQLIVKTLDLMTKFALAPISNHIISSFSLDAFYDLQNIALEFFENLPEDINLQIFTSIEKFLKASLTSMKDLPDQLVYVLSLNRLFSKARETPILTIPIFQSIMQKVFSDYEKSNEIWGCICDEVKNSSFAAATLCRFSQYLATISSPILFDFQINPTIEKCKERDERTKRNRTENPYDFVCENIDLILNNPGKFVQYKLHQNYDFLKQYDEELKKYQFSPLTIPSRGDQSLLELIMIFLVNFDRFNECEQETQQLNLFSIIYSFYHTLIILQRFPPGVVYDRKALFFNSGEHLFSSILSNGSFNLRFSAFKLLSEAINIISMKYSVNSAILTQWYLVLFLFLMSNNQEAIDFAFHQAFITIHIGFIGSSILIPLMITLIENKSISINEDITGLLSAAPLFTEDIIIPKNFLDIVQTKINASPNEFSLTCSGIVGTDLKIRVIKCIRSFHDKIILSAVCSNIAEEIVQNNPSEEILNNLLLVFMELLDLKNQDVLCFLTGILVYFDSLINYSPEGLKELIIYMTDLTETLLDEDEEYIFNFINTLSKVYIYSYKLMKNSDNFIKYIYFLEKVNESEVNEIIKNFSKLSLKLLSIYFGAYPFPNTSLFPSNINTWKSPLLTYSSNNDIIFKEETDENENKSRLSVLNQIGQYVWEFKSISNEMLHDEKVSSFSIPANFNKVKITDDIESDFQREFDESIDSVVEEFERQENTEYKHDVIDDEESEVESTLYSIHSKNNDFSHKSRTINIRPSKDTTNISSLSLNSIGLLNLYEYDKIQKLNPCETLNSLLQQISTHEHRIKMKIAVLYSGPSQEDQNQILSTRIDETSEYFKEFLTGLGWVINLSKHCGHPGGLDLKFNRAGKTSVYYSDFFNEVMFHVSPLLPTSPIDEQQVLKKAHIGNDYVHIVFCDNNHEYQQSTISSPFGIIQFIIYPLHTGLFSVEIFKRAENGMFGPLYCSTIVSKKVLPSLIRSSALNAMGNLWKKQKQFHHPILELSDIIDKTIKTYQKKEDFKYFAFEEIMDLK